MKKKSFYMYLHTILLCVVSLTAFTWAWYSQTVTAGNNTIKVAEYSLNVTVADENSASVAAENGVYKLSGPVISGTSNTTDTTDASDTSGDTSTADTASTTDAAGDSNTKSITYSTYQVTIAASGTADKGYCIVEGSKDASLTEAKVWYSENISSNAAFSFEIKIPENEDYYFKFTSNWGAAGVTDATQIISADSELALAPSQDAETNISPASEGTEDTTTTPEETKDTTTTPEGTKDTTTTPEGTEDT